MSIMIREYLGYVSFDNEGSRKGITNLSEGSHDSDPMSPNSLMVDIEGIHVGPTRNFTRYMESALIGSVKTWTHPYKKPIIMHHNEKDGKIIGRINHVSYVDKNTRSGTGALVFTGNIPDKEGMEQIEDGRLLTVSVGVTGHDVRCSICGHMVSEYGECEEHERGLEYDGEICYWDIYKMEGKELSYVIVPSDIYAKNIRVYKPSKKATNIKESLEKKEGVKSMNEDIKKLEEEINTLKEEKVVLENENKELKEKLDKAIEASENKSSIEEVKEEIEKLKSEVEKLEKELGDAGSTLQSTKEDLILEKGLRESAENKAITLQEERKSVMVENYSLLRKLAGRPEVKVEELKERSEVSIKDAIKDLKEEMESLDGLGSVSKVKNPSISESTTKDVKEEKKVSNIDLEEGLKTLFSGIASKHKYI